MRRDPTKWTFRVLQALAFLFIVAFGIHEIWLVLLKPLLPVLISLIVLVVILWIIFWRRW